MIKKAKLWLLILLATIALLYLASPPRNFTIQIDAKPKGAQEFYVEITSARNNLHGMTVTNIAKGLVPANQQTKISLNQKKILWFGRLTARVYHPEYFHEAKSANNNYFLPSTIFTPISWADILSTEEYLVDQQIYRSGVIGYRDIPMSHLNHHLWFVKDNLIDLYLNNNPKDEIHKSIDILTSNTKQFIKGMLEDHAGEYGETKEMKTEIEKSHSFTNEINEKIN